MISDWLISIQDAEKTALVEEGKKKVHYKFSNGEEMAEEYNLETNILIRRAWKKNENIRKTNEWTIEVGDPEVLPANIDNIGIKESSNSPYVVKRITKMNIEWRIRNLPYPLETYSVLADPSERCIIVRTTNKKYFKKILVEELERVNMLPDQTSIDFSHKFNTLIIVYKKPKEVLDMEKIVQEELRQVQAVDGGDLPCKPS